MGLDVGIGRLKAAARIEGGGVAERSNRADRLSTICPAFLLEQKWPWG